MGVFQNNLMGAAAAAASAGGAAFYDYQIANSYRSLTGVGYFSRTPSSAGNRKTYTISFWFKRTVLTPSGEFDIFCNAQESSSTNYTDSIRFDDSHKLQIAFKGTLSGNLVTTRVFRDTSAWMHIVIAVDTTQGTASNRVKLYINGEQETNFSTETYPAEDYQGGWCNDREHALGRFTGASYTRIGNFYMANFALVDGSQLAPTSFGTSKNGVWIPDDLSGLTWGTTGTWVRFESSSDLGNDSSGNNNDWTNNSVATHDQMLDSPTFDSSSNGGNFATLNPLNTRGSTAVATQLTEGNLKWTPGATQDESSGTMSIGASGVDKVYIEVYCENNSDTGWFGVYDQKDGTLMNAVVQSTASSVRFKPRTGQKVTAGSSSNYIGDGSESNPSGVIFQMAVDVPAGKIWWGRNNAWGSDGADHIDDDNVAFTSLNTDGTYLLFTHTGGASVAQPDWVFNFGQDGTFAGNKTAQGNSDATGYGNFYYSPPTGFKALCAGNVSVADEIDPAQTDDNYPQKLFNAKTYSGSGSTQTISGVGFQPDVTWIKNRSAGSTSGCLMDSTRGEAATNDYYYLRTDVIGAQSNTTDFHNFASDGFIVSGTGTYFNASGNNFVSWNWRVNGGTTATNSNGSVDSTVQVDPSGAFSIAKYRGGLSGAGAETVGHGLSKAPSMIIFKGYSNLAGGDGQWWVGHDELTSWSYMLRLNTDAAQVDKSGNGTMASPTSTVFSVNNTDGLGSGTIDNIAYCFANIEGYCKTGSYKGNGNANGSYVYTGFRPEMVVVKLIDSAGDWWVQDAGRSPGNPANKYIAWNRGDAEATGIDIDILSNGFKIRTTSGDANSNSASIIYVAMAHNPFKYATAR